MHNAKLRESRYRASPAPYLDRMVRGHAQYQSIQDCCQSRVFLTSQENGSDRTRSDDEQLKHSFLEGV